MSHKMIDVQCPTCGESRQIRRSDAGKVKQCQRCHLSGIAGKGWKATKAKYGPKAPVKHLRRYRLANPSSYERQVAEALDEIGARYEREAWFEAGGDVYLLDFALPGGKVIEVNGDWAHSHHEARDARKMAALQAAGYEVLVLDDHALANGYRRRLAEFVS